MTITVTGETMRDMRAQLDFYEKQIPIKITWRITQDFELFVEKRVKGCVVDFGGLDSHEFPVSFENSDEAIECIRAFLKKRDEWIDGGCKPFPQKKHG